VANAGIIVIAGSETTATLLSGVIFLLLTNRDHLQKLTDEVRSTFKAEEEITLTSVQSLSYMLACLNEALRCYPPVMAGMPRITPKGGVMICGRLIPENVRHFTHDLCLLLILTIISDRRSSLAMGH
jgi:cytochrome P450